jgi:uncharacterized membrane protein
MGTLRKYLIAGLLVWLPLTVTIVIFSFVIDVLDGTILLLPPEYRPEAVLGFAVPGFGVVLAVAILILTGMLAANLLGRRLVTIWEAILSRIPLVRTIYNSAKQITTTVLTSEGKAFRKVVLVEYPRKDTWSMGFLTNDQITIDSSRIDSKIAAVFVPTTPNPTSGFIIMLPKDDIIELEISIEEGFKYIISMGVIIPARPITEICPVNKVAKHSTGS